MKIYFLVFCCFIHLCVSYGQDCKTKLEYNKLLKKRQVITVQYVALSTFFGSNLAVGFAKTEYGREPYVLNTEILLGNPYVSNDQDSLVFQFKDGSKLKIVHGYTHNPQKYGILNAYFCYHTFPISTDELNTLASKPLHGVTFYITGTGDFSFDHLSKRRQRKYMKAMRAKTYEIRRINNRKKRKIHRLAACILKAEVPTVEQTLSR